MMQKGKRVFVCAVFLGLLFLSGHSPAQASVTDEAGGSELSRHLERQTFDLINAYRLREGFPRLAWNHAIAEMARHHSHDMATGEVDFGHEGFGDRMKALRGMFVAMRAGGENVFESDDTKEVAQFAVSNWLKSPPHLHNIRGDFNYSGLGLWRNKNGVYFFTQIFVKADGQPSSPTP